MCTIQDIFKIKLKLALILQLKSTYIKNDNNAASKPSTAIKDSSGKIN